MHSPIFYGTDDVKQYLDKPFSTSDHPHDIHNLSQLTKSLFESSVPESDYVTPIVANTDRNSWGLAPDNFDETYMSVVATEGGHLELTITIDHLLAFQQHRIDTINKYVETLKKAQDLNVPVIDENAYFPVEIINDSHLTKQDLFYTMYNYNQLDDSYGGMRLALSLYNHVDYDNGYHIVSVRKLLSMADYFYRRRTDEDPELFKLTIFTDIHGDYHY